MIQARAATRKKVSLGRHQCHVVRVNPTPVKNEEEKNKETSRGAYAVAVKGVPSYLSPVCMYVCIFVCMYVCICGRMSSDVYLLHKYLYVYICIYTYTHTHICTCL